MKEEVILFDTAKLAKEKGFDIIEGCSNFYVKPNCKMFGVDEEGRYYAIQKSSKGRLYTIGQEAVLNIENVILAPTQSLLQKWLRDEYNIHIVVEYVLDKENDARYYCVNVYETNNDRINYELRRLSGDADGLTTYEAALEGGLQIALKLIKS